MPKKSHPLDAQRDADLALIQKIARHAVALYAEHGVRVEYLNVLMDVTFCHFSACKLRLEDLLTADDLNFMHDIGGINRHLDRVEAKLKDGFSPRFHQKVVA